MNFMVDENLPLSFTKIFNALGHNALHVTNLGLNNTPDEKILTYAQNSSLIVVTNDLDFSRLMAIGRYTSPSVLTFRISIFNLSVFEEIISLNLEGLLEYLEEGSMVTVDENRIRILKLPIR